MTKETALRVVVMGTPDFAVPALKAVLGSRHHVIAAYSQPPKPKGRGHEVQKTPLHQAAEDAGIPVYTPKTLRNADAQAELAALKPDIAVVAAYGLLLPKAVLDAPTYGCINLHGSYLPRWRGASPIQHAIWYGDTQTAVTIMQMDVGMDTGDMIKILPHPITPTTTVDGLYRDLAELGAAALPALLDTVADTGARLPAQKQPDEGVTHARLLTKEDGQIDWSKTAWEIDCQIRGLALWPQCYTAGPKGRVKIRAGHATDGTHASPAGSVLNAQGDIACGGGSVLRVTSLQPDNAKPMDMAAALNGGYASMTQVFA